MRRFILSCLAAATCALNAVAAQQSPRSIEGRVRRPMPGKGDSTGMGPAANVWVTLHRLGKDSAGPIDSVRSDAQGRYKLAFRPFGAPEAVYFASVTYGGIAYFAPPAKSEHASGDEGEITVFDTTSRVFPLSVKGRHLIVGKRDTGNVRTVIEVFELSNDSLTTLVATGTTTPTWSVRIPGAASNARVNSDEVSPQAFRAEKGRAEIFAPVPPGVKQLSFTYSVPESAFPLAFTAEAGAVVFEILLEDLDATVQAMGFTRVGEVTLEGRKFQRFLAQDVKPDTRLAIDVPTANAPASGALQRYGIVVAIGFFVLLLVGRRMQRSANARSNAPLPTLRTVVRDDDTEPERLRDAIRQLDAAWARQTNPTEHLQRTYESRRQELEAALAQALAESGTAR
jgi:hypothetical protein